MLREDFFVALKDFGADGVILENPSNYQWLTGFSGEDCFCAVAGDSVCLVVDSRFTLQAEEETAGTGVSVYTYATANERYDLLANFFEKHGTYVLGYEENFLTQKAFEDYLATYGKRFEYIQIQRILDMVRAIKEPWEVEKIKRAARITDESFNAVVKTMKAGMVELDVAAELEYQFRKNGAQTASFDTIVAAGPRGALPHAKPGNKVLTLGDAVVMDFGTRFEGYCSDLTRTVFVGEPTTEMAKVYEVVLKAQMSAIEKAKAGVGLKELDGIARSVIKDAGYGKCFGHSLGHGIGLDIHEHPFVSPKSENVLRKGNVVTVEPGIYLPSIGGVRIEDDVLITADGCEVLTTADKDMIVI